MWARKPTVSTVRMIAHIGVEGRFKQLTTAECEKQGIEILALECHIDHVHIKAMPILWTRSYFVSTAGHVSSETIKWYVDTKKTRP
jgi:putative transposase